jgi:hypothetical protein
VHGANRDQPQFFNAFELDRGPVAWPGPFEGISGVAVSSDARSEAQTLLLELAPGWRREYSATDGTLELLMLRGDVALEGQRVGADGFVQMPQAGGGGELRSERGGVAVAFWNPNMPLFPPPYTVNRVTRLRDEPWVEFPGVHSSMHKSLRVPDMTAGGMEGGPGGFLRLVYLAAGIADPVEHVHHECFEEVILLQGDLLLADEGLLGLGSYSCHPQEWWHGPFMSRSGALYINHTDAPMGVPWEVRDYPGGAAVVDAYLDETPWDAPVTPQAWANTGLAELQRTPEFERWAQSGEGSRDFGDTVGRGAAARFRATWNRDLRAGSVEDGDRDSRAAARQDVALDG